MKTAWYVDRSGFFLVFKAVVLVVVLCLVSVFFAGPTYTQFRARQQLRLIEERIQNGREDLALIARDLAEVKHLNEENIGVAERLARSLAEQFASD